MRPGFGDADMDEMADQRRIAGQINDAVVVSSPEKFLGIFLRDALEQHALHRADHLLADFPRLLIDLRLQALQPFEFDLRRRVVGQISRGCARARAVDEAVGFVEIHVLDQLHCRCKIGFGFTRKADDEVG